MQLSPPVARRVERGEKERVRVGVGGVGRVCRSLEVRVEKRDMGEEG